MVKQSLAIAAFLIVALLVVDVASEVLQAWALHSQSDQGRLIKPHHWVDKPEIGVIV
jgi:hypothetical protein